MAHKKDDPEFPLIFNLIRLRKKQGLLIFMACRTPEKEKFLISKLKEEFAGELSIKEVAFDTADYAPIDFIAVSEDEEDSHGTLYIICRFPFEEFYKYPDSMEDDIDRLVAGLNISRDHISDKDLKIVMICPPELQTRIALKAPDFYRFKSFSASFLDGCKLYVPTDADAKHLEKSRKDKQRKIEFLLEALKTAPKPEVKADICFELGKVYYELSEMDKALVYFQDAESRYNKLKDKKKQANALGNIGAVYSEMSKPEKALKYLEKALTIDQETGYLRGKAVTLGNIGLVYSYMGQQGRALKYLKESVSTFRELGINVPEIFAAQKKILSLPLQKTSSRAKKTKKTKKVHYNVQCAYNPDHVFETVFEIEGGSEGLVETELETFCPFCGKIMAVTIKGIVMPDSAIIR